MSIETDFKRRKGFIVNQSAVSSGRLTYKEVIVLYKLIDQVVFVYEDNPDSLLDKEWFFFMGSQATKYLGMSEQVWCNTVTALSRKGYVDKRICQPKGQYRPKNYYRVNFGAVDKLEYGNTTTLNVNDTQNEECSLNETCSASYTKSMPKPTEVKPKKENQVKRIVASQQAYLNTSLTQEPEQLPLKKTLIVEAPYPKQYLSVLWKGWVSSATATGNYTPTEIGLGRARFNRQASQLYKAYGLVAVEQMIKAWFDDGEFKEERLKAGTNFLGWFFTASERLVVKVNRGGNKATSRADRYLDSSNIKPQIKI
jgi:hypothetical protein